MAKIENEELIEEGINTVLAPDIKFNGTLKFKTSLMIKGKLSGKIDAEGHLVVGPDATIEAEIKAGKVTNYGAIVGNVEVTQKLEMKKGASQTGDMTAPDFIVESGCTINGAMKMSNSVVKKL